MTADDPTLGQAFQLIAGGLLNRMVSEPDNRLGRLLASGKSNTEIVEELYLAALTRLPTAKELQATKTFVEKGDRRAALEDMLWGLANTKEFLLRQ